MLGWPLAGDSLIWTEIPRCVLWALSAKIEDCDSNFSWGIRGIITLLNLDVLYSCNGNIGNERKDLTVDIFSITGPSEPQVACTESYLTHTAEFLNPTGSRNHEDFIYIHDPPFHRLSNIPIHLYFPIDMLEIPNVASHLYIASSALILPANFLLEVTSTIACSPWCSLFNVPPRSFRAVATTSSCFMPTLWLYTILYKRHYGYSR